MRRRLAVAAVAALALTGCGTSGPSATSPTSDATVTQRPAAAAGQLPWNRPADQAAQVAAAGLTLTPEETLAVHYHAHLDVFVNGESVPVPALLGINIGADGMSAPPMGAPGIAALHTHDTSGILHVEAPAAADFTLGQIFIEWGVPLSASHAGAYSPVKVYLNGRPYSGDPTKLVFKDHDEIAVVVGTGNVTVPSSYAWPSGY